MSKRLAGKVVLLTGAAGGFGQVISAIFQSEGATMVVTDADEEAVTRFAQSIGCLGLQQDVSDEARWDEVIRTVEDRHGRLDVLINNAGIEGAFDRVSPEDTDLADFRRVQAVNVEGTFLGCRAAIPALRRAGGGSIINLSSIAGLLATPFQTAYGASKAAVKHLTMSVASHGAREKIRCNAIHPGQMRTRMIDAIYDGAAKRLGLASAAEAEAQFRSMIPMGELGTAEDVAFAALYLASDESRYVTGTSLVVDGGMEIV
jgi:NAD(P)-dependent dehydrogenase (short-subunit alcohol dehydrogenase family)